MTTFKRFLTLFLTTLLTINIWGAETVVYTLDGTITGGSSGYDTESDITQSSISWKVTGNTTMNPWRIGGKSLTAIDRTIYSTGTISNDVTKIEITHGAASSVTVNSMTVVVSKNSDFSSPVSTLTPTFVASNTVTVNRPAGKDWSSCYYKIIYNITISSTSNKFIAFTNAKFYAETGGGTATLTSIAVKTAPTKTTYTEGEYFDPTGLVLSTVYSDSSNPDIDYASHSSDFTFSPSTSTALTTSNTSVTITYGGKSTTQTITVSPAPSVQYELVTDADDLADGDEIIILDTDGSTALSTTQNGNNRSSTTSGFSLSGTTVTVSGSNIEVITLNASSTSWELVTHANQYLYSVSGQNYLRSQDVNTDAGVWSITIDGTSHEADIYCDETSRYLKKNSSSALYATYASGQKAIKIYKKASTTDYTLAGSFNSWGSHYNMTNEGTVYSVTLSLAAMTKYEFKFNKTSNDAWYGNNGMIITDITNWEFGTSGVYDANCRLFTGPAGDYTFTFNSSNNRVSVTYPTVSHPAAGYAYFIKQGSDTHIKVYTHDGTDPCEVTNWAGSVQVDNTIELCGTTYFYFALTNSVNNSSCTKAIIRYNNDGSQKGDFTITDQAYSGKYGSVDDTNWHTFPTYTISFNGNGNTGGTAMSSVTGLACGASTTLLANTYEKSGNTFAGWKTNAAVTANGTPIAVNGIVPDQAALSNISSDITLTAQWEVLPTYTVTFYKKDGSHVDLTEGSYGAGVTPPTQQSPCNGWNFQGWSTSYSNSTTSTTPLALVTLTEGKYHPTSAGITLYPVYTKSGSGSTALTKMTSSDAVANGDQLVIIAHPDGDDYYGCYQETVSSSYVKYWTQASAPTVSDIDDNKKYFTATSTDGGWYLGDVTNGYLYNTSGSNDLTCPTNGNKAVWAIAWDDTNSGWTITSNSRYLSCRSDLTSEHKYKYRGGGATSGSPLGSAYFDLYKYSAGPLYYYSYPTCIECATPSLSFADATITRKMSETGFTYAATPTGNTLEASIVYASSNPSKATVNSDGVVTLLQSTKAGEPITITATLPYTENGAGTACQNEVSASYTLNIKNDIEWYSNETKITSGSQTTETFYSGSISALPSTPAVPSACSDKAFVGWTTEANWDSNDAPNPLYTDLAEFPAIKENKTFYAVFAETTTGDPVSTLTQTMKYDDWSIYDDDGWLSADKDSYRMFGDGAYIESESNVNWANLTQVVVYGGTFGGTSYDDISIRNASGTVWKNATVSGSSAKGENTITGGASLTGTSKLRVYSTCGDGSSNGVRISKVEIYEMVTPMVGTAYVTRCCTDWANPTMTYSKNSIAVGESDATLTKSGAEHGALTFSSSNDAIATVNASGTVHAVSPGNVTITASWAKQGSWCAKEMPINFTITGDVTITFDANGGTGSMASQVVPYATSTSLNTMSGLSKTGKTFVGWNTQADGKGTSYANGASVKLTTNTTLYAQWGTTCTITLHRNDGTQSITVLSTEIPYALPTAEADYCDAWQFDGWNAGSAVANNSDSYTKVTHATELADADFYAVYRGNGSQADAYVRITNMDDLEANKQYIFVGLNNGTKYVMPNTFDATHHNMSGVQIDEDGTDYYLKPTIETSHSGCVYYIKGSKDVWYIQNKNSSSYYINTSVQDFYTTTTSHDTYTITPNGLFWTVYNNYGSSCYGAKPYLEFYKSGTNYLFAKAEVKYGSAALQIYKLGKVQLYKYTSTPSGGDCSSPCEPSGAEFTYPSMEKSTASANFTNTVIYTQKRNTNTPTYTSSKTNVARIVNSETGEVHIEGKGKTTITMTQGRDNTDPSHPICGITLSYELTVTDPTLEVVEVTTDDKLIVEHDFDGITEASVDSSKVDLKGIFADDIFISKYYEAASHMKLFALYNGTEHSVDLSQLRVRSGSSSWGDHGVVTLSKHPKIAEDYPDFQLPSLTEIIFWSNNEDGDNNAQLCSCVRMDIDGKIYNYDDMKADRVPGWYRVETGTGLTRFNFDGNDGLVLERSNDDFTTWVVIDLLGAGTKSAPLSPKSTANGEIQKASINDDEGFYWDATSAADKELSTNRFYLMRLSDVHSGYDAVEKNTDSFVTLGEEWTGRGIGSGTSMTDYCSSGELFSEVAQYDYAKYYTNYVPYEDKWGAYDNGDGTFTIQFNSGELAKLSCKQIQITVKDAVDNSKSAQVEYRVPIIVKSGSNTTTDELFYKHDKDECKVCDVAILEGAVLTKSKPTTPAQVAADRDHVYNVDVYGGGELYVPTGTTYNINTLTIRSKGDAVGVVDVQGTLKRNNATLFHSKRFRNEGSDWRWYYFSLPYDCNVSEVTFSNGEPAKHGVDFQIDWYDGESRASSQANGNWRSIATHPEYPNIIKAGYGYTIAVEEKTGHTNVSLLFPMANFSEATQINVPVGNWGAEDDGVTVNHKGWNVVGNPFLTRYKAQEDLDINGELRTGMLVFEGGGWTQTDDGVNYATVPINGGQRGYSQEALTNRNFDPFQSFIIQVGGDAERNDLAVQLKNAYKYKHPYSIVRRKESEYEVDETTPVWLRLNLSNANGETDNTTVLISDNYTTEYDMQRDLAKWRGTDYRSYTRPVLASVYGGHELAFDALPDEVVADRVPLTYYSRNAGTMAFELSNAHNWQALDEVILYDAKENIQHNLLTNGKYEFQSTAGETGNRFSISAKVNRRKEPAIATGIDLLDVSNLIITVEERNLLINGLEENTTVYVFDMLGHLIGRQTGQSFMRFTIPATGVYNIRIEGQQAGRTLRAIVK